MRILILEDISERREAMRESLEDRFSQYELRFASTAPQMITELEQHLEDALAIALSHDLQPMSADGGKCIDPGTGSDVANYLATQQPSCPVVIHTTNSTAAIAMQSVLDDAGWKTARVLPASGTSWIPTVWFPTMRDMLVGFVPKVATTPE